MAEEIKLKGRCQHCGGKMKFAASMTGTEVTCPHCRRETVLRAATAKPQKFLCPNCQDPIGPRDALCVHCGFRIPRPINWVRWGAAALIFLQLGYLLLRWVGLDPRVQLAFKEKLGLAQSGMYALNPAARSKADATATTEIVPAGPRETGAPRLVFSKQPELNEEGNFYFITGAVKNNSGTDTYFQVSVKFTLQDAQGNPLGVVQDYTALLDPGKTWDFRVLVVDPDATQYIFQEPIGGAR
jgi:hypothetical protein